MISDYTNQEATVLEGTTAAETVTLSDADVGSVSETEPAESATTALRSDPLSIKIDCATSVVASRVVIGSHALGRGPADKCPGVVVFVLGLCTGCNAKLLTAAGPSWTLLSCLPPGSGAG